MKDNYLPMPTTEREREAIASKTAERWQSPNCRGACDGKHIGLIHPKDSGFNFFNYKSFFSTAFLVFKFIYVNVGWRVYSNSLLRKALSDGTLNLLRP